MTHDPVPYDALERIFHEPKRLAIMSTLAASDMPLSFVELKTACGLTDGNLNRHLRVLADEGVVTIEKAFVDAKPRTSVAISPVGLSRFSDYLAALRTVLKQAQHALPKETHAAGLKGAAAHART